MLDTHLANKENYLKAITSKNKELEEIYLTQALSTHRALLKLWNLEGILSATDNWNPIEIQKSKKKDPKKRDFNKVDQSNQEQGSSQGNKKKPKTKPKPKGREWRDSIYGELIRVSRNLQGTYQHLEREKIKNLSKQENQEDQENQEE